MSKKEKVLTEVEKNLSPLSTEMSTQAAKLHASHLAAKYYSMISPNLKKAGSSNKK